MKKYNLSKIMKRAWELVKKTSFGISEALSVSMWESRKEEYNRILSESDAGLVIDLLKWNNETAYMKYYQRLMFDLKHERNTMCKRILSEVYGK